MTGFPRLIGARTDAGVDDVIVDGRTAENLRRLSAALAPFSPYPRGSPAGLPFQWDEATIARGLNFTLTTSIGDIDLPTWIVAKRAAGRRRDLETAAELETLLEERSRSDTTDPDSP